MHSPSAPQVLRLYKDLLRYGQQLKLTDKEYFHKYIRKEFKKNLNLTDKEEITFNFERGLTLLIRKSVV